MPPVNNRNPDFINPDAKDYEKEIAEQLRRDAERAERQAAWEAERQRRDEDERREAERREEEERRERENRESYC
uniref:CCDC50_N domain-containing protein n=1 Tax=Parastrongyloides trichosuri TaxID=131310 RepID=A0A0N4Z2Z8_PARTI